MWTFTTEELNDIRGYRYFVDLGTKSASFSDIIHAWQNDVMFRSKFNKILANVPFLAFRWETPLVTTATISQAFEFVVLDSPWLECRPDPEPFSEHFIESPEQDVLIFPNLGRDAILVVPSGKTSMSAYGHLAAFVRKAPETQQHKLWQAVGEAMTRRVNNTNPVWLSTAGGGVDWLHVRLDDRPKYYGYRPYQQMD